MPAHRARNAGEPAPAPIPADADTYTWLLQADQACPFCGMSRTPARRTCPSCYAPLIERHRAARRSTATFTLAILSGVGGFALLLVSLGIGLRMLGFFPVTDTTGDSPLFQALRMVIQLPAYTGPRWQLPDWSFPAMIVLGILAMALAGAFWSRKPFAFYAGIALTFSGAAVLAATEIMLVGGNIGMILVMITVACVGGTVLVLLAAAPDLLGEVRPLNLAIQGANPHELFDEGRAHYQVGGTFLAARCWAAALAKAPRTPTVLHALGLALARLGHTDRALQQLEVALHESPQDAELRRSYELLRQESGGR